MIDERKLRIWIEGKKKLLKNKDDFEVGGFFILNKLETALNKNEFKYIISIDNIDIDYEVEDLLEILRNPLKIPKLNLNFKEKNSDIEKKIEELK